MFIVPMYRSIGNLWAGMTWAFISVAMLPSASTSRGTRPCLVLSY